MAGCSSIISVKSHEFQIFLLSIVNYHCLNIAFKVRKRKIQKKIKIEKRADCKTRKVQPHTKKDKQNLKVCKLKIPLLKNTLLVSQTA